MKKKILRKFNIHLLLKTLQKVGTKGIQLNITKTV